MRGRIRWLLPERRAEPGVLLSQLYHIHALFSRWREEKLSVFLTSTHHDSGGPGAALRRGRERGDTAHLGRGLRPAPPNAHELRNEIVEELNLI